VEVDGWYHGQCPPIRDDAALPAGIEAQTRRVMDNLTLVLNGVGPRTSAARVFLTHFERDYADELRIDPAFRPPTSSAGTHVIGVTGLAYAWSSDLIARSVLANREVDARGRPCPIPSAVSFGAMTNIRSEAMPSLPRTIP
jgi:hypothetical protein